MMAIEAMPVVVMVLRLSWRQRPKKNCKSKNRKKRALHAHL
jgi:hypothetical protein